VTEDVGPRDPGSRLGRVVAGRYLLTAVLGQGGMGSIYRATHVALNEPVVVKFLHPFQGHDRELRERFRREAKVLIRLHHPGIVTIHDFGEDLDEPYIAMELVEGMTFEEFFARDRRPPLSVVFDIFDQILDVLATSHAAGIIHRDIKPENVMITDRPGTPHRVKVLDFGIAHLDSDHPGAQTKLTVTGTIVGTPNYMSPEQCRGGDVVPESDVYSVAIMLYFALTRNLPFDAQSAVEIFARHLYVNPPTLAEKGAPADLPPGLETLVARGLAKNPFDRPSAAGFREALQEVASARCEASVVAAAIVDRQKAAGQSRKERSDEMLAQQVTRRTDGPPSDPEAVEETSLVLLWGFAPNRTATLRDAFAANHIMTKVVPEEDGTGSNAPAPLIDDYIQAVVVSGDNWRGRLETLGRSSKRPPVFVIDVPSASDISALIRAGASDVALLTIPVDVLASKLRRLIRRTRSRP
jgi:eukaryotic-like serine/threonine-protein kinase